MSSAVRSTDTAQAPLARERVAPCRRADAYRNHERILSAARAVFVEDGPEASLDEVARPRPCSDRTAFDARVGRYVELFLAGLCAPAPNELPGSSPASTDLPSTSAVPARRR